MGLAFAALAALSSSCAGSGSAGAYVEERPAAAKSPPDAALVAEWQSAFEARTFESKNGLVLPYRIRRPDGRLRRPLVLVLHGSGAIGTDNRAQLGPFAASWASRDLAPCAAPIIIVPQVPSRSSDYLVRGDRPYASRPGPSFAALLELVDRLVQDDGVDPKRVYVSGFSMGASAALQLALARPRAFAALVLFAPVPPPAARASEVKDLDLLVVHGDADIENPFAASRDWVRAVWSAGGRPRMIVYRGMDHRVPDAMLTDPGWRKRLLCP